METNQRRVLTISELNAQVHELLETSFSELWIEGEVSNCKAYPSGHTYLTLKDEKAQVRAVLFKGASFGVKFKLADGQKILVRGRVTSYEPRGELQLIISAAEPRDKGALQLALEQLKAKLQAEGLFDAERKKPLPPFPKSVGVVTSGQGAAVRDVIQVLSRRWPGLDIRIWPVKVQGPGAAEEIAAAVRGFNALASDTDVLLVGRGGGSIEDLWAFNEEPVARAIAESEIPVISCVGHETDWTVADLAVLHAADAGRLPARRLSLRSLSRGTLAGLRRGVHAQLDVLGEGRRPLVFFRRERLLDELPAVGRERLDLGLGFFKPLGQVLGEHDPFLEKGERLLEPLVAALQLAHQLLERGQRALEIFGLGSLRHDVTSQLISPSDRRTRTTSPSFTWDLR